MRFFVLAAALLSAACTESGPAPAFVGTPANIAGNWGGSARSNRGQGQLSTFSLFLRQRGSVLSGGVDVQGSPCVGLMSVSGEFTSEDRFTLTGTGYDDAAFSLDGQLGPNDSIYGRYTVSGGACNGDAGGWSAIKQTKALLVITGNGPHVTTHRVLISHRP